MYQISEKQWAVEEGESIEFVRDGGGVLAVVVRLKDGRGKVIAYRDTVKLYALLSPLDKGTVLC